MTRKINKKNEIEERIYLGDREEEVYKKHIVPDHVYPGITMEYPEKEPYVPSEDLAQAVNLAMYLGRPLLLEGETGCGKSRLAFSVAWELGYPLFQYYVHSSAKAKDLLYSFDQLKRLRDAQNGGNNSQRSDLDDSSRYIRLGPLGWAIRISAEKGIPSVVLIDEIDKGDYDFPNDLLLELERLEFRVEDFEEQYKAVNEQYKRPLVIITSNREKALPRPFLRRCVYHFVSFPEPERLDEILFRQFKANVPDNLTLVEARKTWNLAIDKFDLLRKQLRGHQPGTSELIDWVNVLLNWNSGFDSQKLEQISQSTLAKLPYLDLLIKNEHDLRKLRSGT
ncbi:MAG: MoxR family ATPase [Chloroflexi bacterium]|nr:MoxR family ATPase [Chloroflexota bacterium]